MKVSKIHSKYVIQMLFSFISENRKFKLIKYNSFLINKLELSIKDFKIFFLQKKIENYDYIYIKDYYEEFKKNFNTIIHNEVELKELFNNSLSKNKNFELNLLDKDFNSIINNPYFKGNIRINIEGLNKVNIPKILLIKDNKLTDKTIKTFNDIFKRFSSNGKMNKTQCALFISNIMKKEINEDDERVNFLFFNYDLDNDRLLSFEEYFQFYCDSIKNKINVVWDNLYSLGYNNLLEQSKEIDIDFIINNLDKFDINPNHIFFNLYNISKEKIYQLSLLINIDKIFIQFLNNNQIFKNIKQINISISNLNQLIELKIICFNIEELNLEVFDEDLKYNYNEINNIFPNMKIFNIYIEREFNIFDLMKNLINSKLEILKIFIYNYGFEINYKFDYHIILKNIKNLEINIEEGYNINDFLFNFFNNIQFPSLKQYILNLDLNQFNHQILTPNNYDYNIINQFLIHILNNQNQFCLKSFFNLINQIQFINYFHLNLRDFNFIYKNNRGQKYLFKFNINNTDVFKKYYSNYDLTIDEKEILQYKKIDINGIKFGNNINIKKIIEKKDINICDIYLNSFQEEYFIKSFKKLRSINSEEEIQQNNLLLINELFKGHINNLKYINLNLCDIDISILLRNIKNCENLKSLKLKLHHNTINQNINLFLKLIENLKQLKIINIISNNNYPKYDICLFEKLNHYPKIKERKYYYEEFIIGNEVYISKSKKKNNSINFNIKCIYEIKSYEIRKEIKLLNNDKEINDNCELYLNYDKIKNFKYIFPKEGKYILKFIFIKPIKTSLIFSGCSSLTSLNISNFNTIMIENMNRMFYNCSSLTSLDLSHFNTNNVKYMNSMFYNCFSLISLNLSNFNTRNVKYMNRMFYNCSSLTSLNLSNFNTINVKDMSNMFYNCSSLKSLDLSNFNTNKVKYMNRMFYKCRSLTSLNLSNFITTNVKNMNGMFLKCCTLTSLNLSNFNTINVKYINDMFSNCYSLISLNLTNFNTNNVKNMSCMFLKCSSLISLNLSHFNTNNTKNMNDMFLKCSSLTVLNLSNFKTINVKNIHNIFLGINNNCIIISNDSKILNIINNQNA